MGDVTDDRLSRAVSELYAAHPDGFVELRQALAGEARAAGEAAVATAIAALRRPTLSAWLVNRLARSQPQVIAELVELGEQLRSAQRSLDAARMRELTSSRRKAVGAALAAALLATPERRPSEAVTEQVRATLDAAVADRDIAVDVAAGRLTRAQEWSGFGDVGPELTVVQPVTERRPVGSAPRRSRPAPAQARAAPAAQPPSEPEPGNSHRVTIAETELAAAEAALIAAQDSSDSAAAEVTQRERALSDARSGLRAAASELRVAKERRDRALRRLARVRG